LLLLISLIHSRLFVGCYFFSLFGASSLNQVTLEMSGRKVDAIAVNGLPDDWLEFKTLAAGAAEHVGQFGGAVLCLCSPRLNLNKTADVGVSGDRKKWHDVATITIGMSVDGTEKYSKRLKSKLKC
jgi:hypothetical protein